jgi:hypothetical protein
VTIPRSSNLLRPVLLDLLLAQIPQLVHIRRLSSRNTLCQLDEATNLRLLRHSVLRGASLDADDANARVLGTTVVLAVTEVADPGLERGGVVLADDFAVGLDGGVAGDGGPLARVVDEADVDGCVLLEVVGLAGLGVGVEEEVEAVALLDGC